MIKRRFSTLGRELPIATPLTPTPPATQPPAIPLPIPSPHAVEKYVARQLETLEKMGSTTTRNEGIYIATFPLRNMEIDMEIRRSPPNNSGLARHTHINYYVSTNRAIIYNEPVDAPKELEKNRLPAIWEPLSNATPVYGRWVYNYYIHRKTPSRLVEDNYTIYIAIEMEGVDYHYIIRGIGGVQELILNASIPFNGNTKNIHDVLRILTPPQNQSWGEEYTGEEPSPA